MSTEFLRTRELVVCTFSCVERFVNAADFRPSFVYILYASVNFHAQSSNDVFDNWLLHFAMRYPYPLGAKAVWSIFLGVRNVCAVFVALRFTDPSHTSQTLLRTQKSDDSWN